MFTTQLIHRREHIHVSDMGQCDLDLHAMQKSLKMPYPYLVHRIQVRSWMVGRVQVEEKVADLQEIATLVSFWWYERAITFTSKSIRSRVLGFW